MHSPKEGTEFARQPCYRIPKTRDLGQWLCVPSFRMVCPFLAFFYEPLFVRDNLSVLLCCRAKSAKLAKLKLFSWRPLRLCARYSGFFLRTCRAVPRR